MKRSKINIIFFSVVFVLYVAVFCLIPLQRNEAIWSVFAFTCVAILLSAILTIYVSKKGDDAKSKIYGFSLMKISFTYVIVQLVFSVAIFAISSVIQIAMWVSIICSVIFMVVFLVGMISGDATRNAVDKMESQTQEKISKMQSIKQKIKTMQCSNMKPETIKEFERLKEFIIYSDPVSSAQTYELEEKIDYELTELQAYMVSGSENEVNLKINLLHQIISERNEICKINKK